MDFAVFFLPSVSFTVGLFEGLNWSEGMLSVRLRFARRVRKRRVLCAQSVQVVRHDALVYEQNAVHFCDYLTCLNSHASSSLGKSLLIVEPLCLGLLTKGST